MAGGWYNSGSRQPLSQERVTPTGELDCSSRREKGASDDVTESLVRLPFDYIPTYSGILYTSSILHWSHSA